MCGLVTLRNAQTRASAYTTFMDSAHGSAYPQSMTGIGEKVDRRDRERRAAADDDQPAEDVWVQAWAELSVS